MLLKRIWPRKDAVKKEMSWGLQAEMEQERRCEEANLLLTLASIARKVFR
jgi:hypothetical protein